MSLYERPKPKLKDIEKLPKLHRLVMEYFIKYISVGELAAIIDLREQIKALGDTEIVPEIDDVIIEIYVSRALGDLVRQGFLEKVEGVYNLAPHLREELKQKKTYRPTGTQTLF